jgi:hypothetical protein
LISLSTCPFSVLDSFHEKEELRLVAEALMENDWLSDIDMDLSIEGCAQCVRLWEEIEAVPRNNQVPVSFSWTGSASGA